jgi:hypothetical protein
MNNFVRQKNPSESTLILFAHILPRMTSIPHGKEEVVETVLHQLIRQSSVGQSGTLPVGQSLQNIYWAISSVTSIVATILKTEYQEPSSYSDYFPEYKQHCLDSRSTRALNIILIIVSKIGHTQVKELSFSQNLQIELLETGWKPLNCQVPSEPFSSRIWRGA